MTEAHLPLWDAYLRLQKRANYASRIDSKSWGLEEEMNLILDDPDAYVSGKLAAKLRTANASAARRERAHAQLRTQHEAEIAPEPPKTERHLEARETLRLVEGSMTPSNWQLLLHIGHGHTYIDLAKAVNIKPGTMRVLVSRLRAQSAHLYAA